MIPFIEKTLHYLSSSRNIIKEIALGFQGSDQAKEANHHFCYTQQAKSYSPQVKAQAYSYISTFKQMEISMS